MASNNIKNSKLPKAILILINIFYLVILAISAMPLLYIGKYNYPSADDWSYGEYTVKVIRNGEGFFALIREALRTAKNAYLIWDGRFGSNFFLALQPGIFGESHYRIVPYLMIGIIVFSELFVIYSLLTLRNKQSSPFIIPILVPWIIYQLMYAPFPVETFYWYTGSFSYTFVNGLALILYALFIRLAEGKASKPQKIFYVVLSSILCIIVGAGNYSTMVYAFLAIALHATYYFIFNRSKFKKIVFMLPVYAASSITSFLSPGRKTTFSANYSNGISGYGFIESIFVSLYRTFLNIYSWTNVTIILLVLLTVPFMIIAVKKSDLKFRYPLLFTFLSFGVYASMISPNIYTQGNTGGGRTGDIIFYMYIVWMIANLLYWTGWIVNHLHIEKLNDKIKSFWPIAYYIVIAGLLCLVIYKSDWRKINQYNAYRDVKQGWAKQYSIEWNERFVVLNDESITDPVFDKLSTNPETIMYTDLQDEDGYTWINVVCSYYYEKNSVTVR